MDFCRNSGNPNSGNSGKATIARQTQSTLFCDHHHCPAIFRKNTIGWASNRRLDERKERGKLWLPLHVLISSTFSIQQINFPRASDSSVRENMLLHWSSTRTASQYQATLLRTTSSCSFTTWMISRT